VPSNIVRALRLLSLASSLILASCAGGVPRPAMSSADTSPGSAEERSESIFATAGIEAYPSSPITKLSMDGDAWYERAVELIRGAEDYILVDSFLLTEHPRARSILVELKSAIDRGVRVRFIVDSASYYRTYPMSKEPVPAIIPYARSLGIPVVEYNPIRGTRILTLFGLLYRDHRKFWIVDGRIAALGGQNVDHDSLRGLEDSGGVDAMVEFSSSGAIAELRDSFVEEWNAYSVDRISPDDFAVRACPGDVRVRLVDQVRGKGGRVTAMFDGIIERARRELVFVECYTYLTPALVARVKRAVERGVEVRFILSSGHLNVRAERGSYYCMASLIRAGAKVYLYESPVGCFLHYKLIMADGEMASIGSANYNLRSQSLSRELSVIFDDPTSLDAVKKSLRGIEPRLREIGIEEAEEHRRFPDFFYFMLMQVGG
jgi:cardiolipin synthase A/B